MTYNVCDGTLNLAVSIYRV